jgi:hypothetical protein
VEDPHDGRALVGVGGEHHRPRQPPVRREAIGLVDQEAVRVRDDVTPPDDLTEPALERDGERLGHRGTLVEDGVGDTRG